MHSCGSTNFVKHLHNVRTRPGEGCFSCDAHAVCAYGTEWRGTHWNGECKKDHGPSLGGEGQHLRPAVGRTHLTVFRLTFFHFCEWPIWTYRQCTNAVSPIPHYYQTLTEHLEKTETQSDPLFLILWMRYVCAYVEYAVPSSVGSTERRTCNCSMHACGCCLPMYNFFITLIKHLHYSP